MILSFTLSMPGVSSWNGKWTGDGTLYARVQKFGKKSDWAQEILKRGYFSYFFGDGWRAGVTVKEVDAKEAARIRKHSAGFCGYDWMITSIIDHLQIQVNQKC